MKGAGEHEEVIAVELLETGVELAVVDQTAGLAYYEEREDDPGGVNCAVGRAGCGEQGIAVVAHILRMG